MDDQSDDLFFAKYLTKNQSIAENDQQKQTNITKTKEIDYNQDRANNNQNNYFELQKNKEYNFESQKESFKKLQQNLQNKKSTLTINRKIQSQICQISQQRKQQRRPQLFQSKKNMSEQHQQSKIKDSSDQAEDEDDENDNRFQLLCQKYQKTINKSKSSSPSLYENDKASDYTPRNQLQKHLTLSGEHLKQIQSILQQNQVKDKGNELFKTISFNGEKDERLIIKNSLGKEKDRISLNSFGKNNSKSKQQSSQKINFNYDVIQSENSQSDFDNKIKINQKKKNTSNNKVSCYLDRYSLAQSQQQFKSQTKRQEKIQPFRMSQKVKIGQILYENQCDQVKTSFIKKLAQSLDREKISQILPQQNDSHKQSEIGPVEQTIVQNYRDYKNHNKLQKCSNSNSFLKHHNESLQKQCSGCSRCPFYSKIQLQNKMHVELIQKVQNLQKMVNSLRKFKQNREALQIQSNSNQSKSIKGLKVQKNIQKKRHHKKSSQISCNSQQTSKTSNFKKQSSKRGKSTSLLTQIKLLKAQVEYLQQEKRLKSIGQKQKRFSNKQKFRKKTSSSYSQTHLLTNNNKSNQVFARRVQNKNVHEQQYYNNQTIKYQKPGLACLNTLPQAQNVEQSPYYTQQTYQAPKINIEFNDLAAKVHQNKSNQKQIQKLQQKNNKQKYALYEHMVSKLPKRCPKETDEQKKLFNLAIKCYKNFLPQNLEIENMSITKYDKFVHFRTNLLNFDILWYFNGHFYCGQTLQVKQSENNIKKQHKKSTSIHKQGEGIQIIPSKYVHQGRFQNNKKSGYGVINFEDGSLYEGTWQKNQMNGRGTFTSALGDIYQGEMKDNQKNGVGKQYFKNGDKYKGQYIKGSFDGKGKYKWFNGSSYKGQFKNGNLHGVGVWKSGFGDKYQGEYQNNLKHGYGIYEWKNGTKYEGYFFNGVKVGEQQRKFKFHKIQKSSNSILNKNKKGIHKYKSEEKYRLF